MKTMKQMRAEIDRIDEEIVRLLENRIRVVLEISEYKKEHGIPVNDPAREDDILARLASGKIDEGMIRKVYRTIFSCSRNIQKM
ncbi:chorismate mutase [Candidatus Fermentibacteria bacterium]|nr:MAG: chorismate mutase [Candidatus Fermentibacteria bacterium]